MAARARPVGGGCPGATRGELDLVAVVPWSWWEQLARSRGFANRLRIDQIVSRSEFGDARSLRASLQPLLELSDRLIPPSDSLARPGHLPAEQLILPKQHRACDLAAPLEDPFRLGALHILGFDGAELCPPRTDACSGRSRTRTWDLFLIREAL